MINQIKMHNKTYHIALLSKFSRLNIPPNRPGNANSFALNNWKKFLPLSNSGYAPDNNW